MPIRFARPPPRPAALGVGVALKAEEAAWEGGKGEAAVAKSAKSVHNDIRIEDLV